MSLGDEIEIPPGKQDNLTAFPTFQPSFAFPATSVESEIGKYLLIFLLLR